MYYKTQLKRADWEVYVSSRAWRLNPEEMLTSAEELLEDTCGRFKKASGVAIPEIIHSKFYPKPYRTNELTVSRRNRERNFTRNLEEQNQFKT